MKLELKGRIDSNNAVQVEKEMRDQLTGQNDVEVVLDATDLESLATTPSDAAKTIRGMGLAETAALTLRYTDRYGAVRSEPDPIKTAIDELRAAGAGSAERDTRADQPVKLRDKEDARCFA